MNRSVIALFSIALLLSCMGLIMVYNTTSAEVIDKSSVQSLNHALVKQLIHAVIGCLLGVCIFKMGYHTILKHSPTLLIGLTVCLFLALIPPFGLELNGAKRWIKIFGISFQPSEFVKILIPFVFVKAMQLKAYQVSFKELMRIVLLLSIPIFLILIEPDNGSVAIILATLIVLFFLTRVNWKYWAIPILCVLTVGFGLGSQLPYVKARINVYLHPEHDLLGKGHQPYQAKIAAGAGGVLGRGMGKSMQKLSYLPEARSDYIAAIYAEEFGFLGIVFLTLLYMGLVFIGSSIALKAVDREGALIAISLTFLLTFQAFINLGVVCGLLPSKGTNLPLFSHGGTSLIANLSIIAIFMDISLKHWKQAHES